MRIIAFFTFTLSLATPLLVHAQTFGGVGVRADGMGGAFVAVADDASAIYWNPAGIATGATFDLQAAGGSGSTAFVGASLPVLGVGFYRTRFATVSDRPGRQNGGSGEVHVRALTTANTGVTVVQTVVPGLVIGTTARVVRAGDGSGDSRTTLDLDAGAMVSAWDVRFGLVARNLRAPELGFPEGAIALKRQVRVGAALAPRALPSGVHGPFTLAVDADLTTAHVAGRERRGAAVGGEYWVGEGRVGGRAGVRWSTLGDSSRAISGGFSVRMPRSVYVEGQATKGDDDFESEWTIGARVTF